MCCHQFWFHSSAFLLSDCQRKCSFGIQFLCKTRLLYIMVGGLLSSNILFLDTLLHKEKKNYPFLLSELLLQLLFKHFYPEILRCVYIENIFGRLWQNFDNSHVIFLFSFHWEVIWKVHIYILVAWIEKSISVVRICPDIYKFRQKQIWKHWCFVPLRCTHK